MQQLTRDQLIQLVLKAENDNGGDPVHVANAGKIVDAFLLTLSPAPTPQPAPQPQPSPSPKPTPTTTVSKPFWLGDWSGNVGDFVKNNLTSDTTLFVLYNIPGRDNGNYSAGGLHSAAEYHSWVQQIANAINSAKVIIILEPDALGLSRALSDQQKSDRYAMLNDAVKILKANKNTKVYVDSSIWAGAGDSVSLLNKISGVDGFSCNVSGYLDTNTCVQYASQVHNQTNLPYVIDTSRNGNGAPHGANLWCNQTDTKIGAVNTQTTGTVGCDWFLWIKVPGESDGPGINDDGTHPRSDVPAAGTYWPELHDALYSGNWTAFKQKYHV